MADKRFYILIFLLFLGVILTFVLKPIKIESNLDIRVRDLPKAFGEYKSRDIELKDTVYNILETKNVIMREYIKGNEPPILFYLIFSKQTYKSSDPPENCLLGEGRAIISKTLEELPEVGLTVNKLLVEKSLRKNIYLYWFIAGDEFFDSYFRQRLTLVLSYIRRQPKSGGQVRISTSVVDNNEQEALRRLKEFIREIMPYLKKLLL